jgi:hypothetical protein
MHCAVASVHNPVASMHSVMADTTHFRAWLRRRRAWRLRHVLALLTTRRPCPAPFAGSHAKSPAPGFRSTVFR